MLSRETLVIGKPNEKHAIVKKQRIPIKHIFNRKKKPVKNMHMFKKCKAKDKADHKSNHDASRFVFPAE